MSCSTKFVVTLDRMASLTSTIRTRNADAVRYTNNGGTPDDLRQRLCVVVTQLERMAAKLDAKLEKAVS